MASRFGAQGTGRYAVERVAHEGRVTPPRPSIGESLVVVVADSAEERVALAGGLPVGASILVARDITQARQVLAHLPAGGQSTRPAARPVSGRPSAGRRRELQSVADLLRLREDRQSLMLGDREVALTQLEFALLSHLLPRLGEVASFEELSQVGWRTAYLGNGAHMHAAIGRLRLKLAELRAPLRLEAVRGLGFRLTAHRPTPRLQEAVGD